MYVSKAVAEEVVQDTWLGVLNGIHRFGARSSLRTSIFRILINRTKTWMQRGGRSIPLSAM
jgi:RNA polymerase sigma-70 factor, ECF subfamily